MIRLFLDTEWADLLGSQLISLALVSEDGLHRFYAEIDPLPEQPTDFVRVAVYPLLERGAAALTEAAFTEKLRAFFREIGEDCVVHYDYCLDGDFLRYALDGFDNPEPPDLQGGSESAARIEIRTELLVNARVMHYAERYFATRPGMAARRHHAGVDAEALRRGYLAEFSGVPVGSGSP